MTTWIILGGIVLIVFWIIGTYNSLVKLRTQAEEGWSDIDVQLKRRYDLIPNLIETVKGYAAHEKEVFQKVTEARANAMRAESGGNAKELLAAENMLSSTLKSLFAVSENYPQLKADQNFAKLQDELADTENKIQASRRFYNGTVRDLNTKIDTFPTKLIASPFGFAKREFFEVENEAERATPQVKF
ncbi:MAG: LemA family protein [Candidatus Kerfeldbacteria bacterium]|nr:LemA family protein [Candidatus Kerfeldbacteria bacterium]